MDLEIWIRIWIEIGFSFQFPIVFAPGHGNIHHRPDTDDDVGDDDSLSLRISFRISNGRIWQLAVATFAILLLVLPKARESSKQPQLSFPKVPDSTCPFYFPDFRDSRIPGLRIRPSSVFKFHY